MTTAHRLQRLARLCLLALLLLPAASLRAQDLDLDLDLKGDAGGEKKGDLDKFLSDIAGQTIFRLCPFDDPEADLAQRLYWRQMPDYFAAVTTIPTFQIDHNNLIAPQPVEKLLPIEHEFTYPIEAGKKLAAGKHILSPCAISIEASDTAITSSHPAVKVISQKKVLILCAPVRFAAVNAQGIPTAAPLELAWADISLLRHPGRFHPLGIYLPVGCEYRSSWGRFELTADGKVKPLQLKPNVKADESGLHWNMPADEVAANPVPPAGDASRWQFLRITTGDENATPLSVAMSFCVEPGAPILLAFSRVQYRKLVGKDVDPAGFALTPQVRMPLGVEAGRLSFHTAAPADDAAALAQKLGGPAADLVWLSASSPQSYGGRRLVLSSPAGQVAAPVVFAYRAAGFALHLIPPRLRTAFSERETAEFQVAIAPSFPGGKVRVLAGPEQVGGPTLSCGEFELPAAQGQWDSHFFRLAMDHLPPGRYRLSLAGSDGKALAGGIPLNIVPWRIASSFLVQTTSVCTELWPDSDAGLTTLRDAGLSMVSAAGSSSLLLDQMPSFDRSLAGALATANLPPALALLPAHNDLYLDRLTAHQLRLIDLTVLRGPGLYNESLSYHHSYLPSVERMLRRMQVFTQQTEDYPAFWGVNYSWFPHWQGYVEGGVPCDAHVADRNEALRKNLAEAGYQPVSPEDQKWYREHRGETEQRDKALAIQRQAAKWRIGQDEFAYGKHNTLYNAAVRQVKPDAVCTLFDNAGHDGSKRTRALFNDMSAVCYESYTDYGDWPMSSGYVTDWARGQSPGQDVWLTACWGGSAESMFKQLFHAFARGLAGGGVPMQAGEGPAELARRGKGLRFLAQYGAIARAASPDRRFTILATEAKLTFDPRAYYDYHAANMFLTRLGYPCAILAEPEALTTGISADVQVLVLVDELDPLTPELLKAIASFTARGGKVLCVGQCDAALPRDGLVSVGESLKNIWDFSGFLPQAHVEMWQYFESDWRLPLQQTLDKLNVPALALIDPLQAYALAQDAGPIRYVTVIADKAGTHNNFFEPLEQLPLTLDGEGWHVRDLGKQIDLPGQSKGGKTLTQVDMITEPALILALYKQAPARVTVLASDAKLGGTLSLGCQVADQKEGGQDLGPVPVRLTVRDSAGAVRGQWHRAAGDRVELNLPVLDQAGKWTLEAQELITGLTATVAIDVAAAAGTPAARLLEAVQVVDERKLQLFLGHPGEKLVIVEATHPRKQILLPLAKQVVAAIVKAGGKARLWELLPEECDTWPVRFYPREEEATELAQILQGKLVGYRGALRAYIDKKTRQHLPEFGGYQQIDPHWMVGQDCIVFAGGDLADSLWQVNPALNQASRPGKGQGRLVVCLSPFMAQAHALAISAGDDTGFSAVVQTLLQRLAAGPAQTPAPAAPAAGLTGLQAMTATLSTMPVDRPWSNFTPLRRIAAVLASPQSGRAAVLLSGKKDTVVFVDEGGKITASVAPYSFEPEVCRLDNAGDLWDLARQASIQGGPTKGHHGGSFDVFLRKISRTGALEKKLLAYRGELTLPPGFPAGWAASPDGNTVALGRPGGVLLGGLADEMWRWRADVGHARAVYEVLYPRFPVGSAFSPDGEVLLITMDSRAPLNSMNGPLTMPTGSETMLLEAASGKVLWRLRDAENRPTYAAHQGFAAVAQAGSVSAIAGYDGLCLLVNKGGKILWQEQVVPAPNNRSGLGPQGGVGVSISPDGKLAAFAFRNRLVLASPGGDGQGSSTAASSAVVPLAGVASVCVSSDGKLAAVGLEEGVVHAFSAAGTPLWSVQLGGVGPQLAAGPAGGIYVGSSAGELLLLDGSGQEVRRLAVAAAADAAAHPLPDLAAGQAIIEPLDYREPGTLALAQERLQAKQVAVWAPSAAGEKRWGLTFAPLPAGQKIELAGGAAGGEFFLHLVYRLADAQAGATITTGGKDGPQTFRLDLPTPQYRVLDVPLRGPGAKATIVAGCDMEVAQASLWHYQLPGPNVAFVQPLKPGEMSKNDAGELLAELEDSGPAAGSMKDCKVYWPNCDPDRVAGVFLRPLVDPLQVVDGKRFGDTPLPPFAQRSMHAAMWGGYLVIDFGSTSKVSLSLVATSDRAVRQSEVARSIAVFHQPADMEPPSHGGHSGVVIGGVVDNDQFWRLIPVMPTTLSRLGVQAFTDSNHASGLSEVEAYH